MRPSRFLLLLLPVVLLAGCATSRPAGPAAPAAPAAPAGVPGFDTWRYPGDAVMEAWHAASPYRWVGYYLPAPCRRDASWAGTRAGLERMGWGLAVLYVGQQAFEGTPEPDSTAGPIRCSRTLLTEAQARTDAADAAARAAAEGFAPGTTVYLNVERADVLPAGLLTYVRTWTAEVVRDGRYVPGVYAHRANADALFAVTLAEYRAAGRTDRPPFWVAGGAGFTLAQAPEGAGVPFADVWQGALDVERTWGGVTLAVDENVARRPSPSAPRPAGAR